ncbi:NAD-dependent epimerase/dehydratase family protein [Marimonas lutisalis]|uniref:NAD-dependent epimerase/dehydratase family protein n=1 Tax=Marimonas lutisalis TaxID=2545756 RepID=UPI001375F011|nr:NAD-dependent epimerase/dehydratase family protein [Marimonas lutisalis]
MTGKTHRPELLILGASGKLGRLLAREWERGGPRGFHPLWQYRATAPAGGITWSPGQPFPDNVPRPKAILALWGVTPGPGRDLADNIRLAHTAMTLAADLGAERVLHCSSSAVYEPGPDPLGENEAGGRINAYGQAKLEMEREIAAWQARHPDGPRNVVMRLANVAGADSLFAALAHATGPITLDRFDDGQGPWRSYVTAPTLARVIEALLAAPRDALPDVVNVAGRRDVAMEAIVRAANRELAWRPAPESAARRVALATERLSRIIQLDEQAATAEDIIAAAHGGETLT